MVRVSEVQEQTQLTTCSMKIIIYLRTVSFVKFAYCLQFHNYLPIANEVCSVGLLQLHTIISYLQFLLTLIRYLLSLKLYLKCFLINRLKKAVAKSIVDLESCAYDFITLLRVNNHRKLNFVLIREIRVL